MMLHIYLKEKKINKAKSSFLNLYLDCLRGHFGFNLCQLMFESLSAPQPSAGLSLSRKAHALHDLLSPSNMPKDTHTHTHKCTKTKKAAFNSTYCWVAI